MIKEREIKIGEESVVVKSPVGNFLNMYAEDLDKISPTQI